MAKQGRSDQTGDGSGEGAEGGDLTVVAEIQKSRGEVVRVGLRRYGGRHYLDLRTWYWDESGPEEELKPTRKGISLRVDQLPELQAAVEALAKKAADLPAGGVPAEAAGKATAGRKAV